MNSRERILTTLKGQVPDRVPVSLNTLSTGLMRADNNLLYDLLEYTDPNVWVYLDDNFLGLDMIFGKNLYNFSKIIEQGHQKTITIETPKGRLMQVTEKRDESDWITQPFFNNMRDIEKFFSFQYEPFDNINLKEYKYWDTFINEQGIASIVLYDAAIMLYTLLGPKQYYLQLMDNFETVKYFTQVAAERIENYVKKLFDIIKEEPIVFLIAGPEAFTKPMTSNYYYEQLVLPYDKKLIQLIHDQGGIANIHQHGMVSDSLDCLLDMNPNAISPFEQEPSGDIEIGEAKRHFQNKICVIGNLDDQKILSNPDKKDIEIMTLILLKNVSLGGRFILGGTDSSILTDEMLRSFILMGKLCQMYGRYPINLDKLAEKINILQLHSID